MPYARAYKDLESAKAALKADFEKCTRLFVGTEHEWIDEEADISRDGMKWWSRNSNQTYCEIIEAELN